MGQGKLPPGKTPPTQNFEGKLPRRKITPRKTTPGENYPLKEINKKKARLVLNLESEAGFKSFDFKLFPIKLCRTDFNCAMC